MGYAEFRAAGRRHWHARGEQSRGSKHDASRVPAAIGCELQAAEQDGGMRTPKGSQAASRTQAINWMRARRRLHAGREQDGEREAEDHGMRFCEASCTSDASENERHEAANAGHMRDARAVLEHLELRPQELASASRMRRVRGPKPSTDGDEASSEAHSLRRQGPGVPAFQEARGEEGRHHVCTDERAVTPRTRASPRPLGRGTKA